MCGIVGVRQSWLGKRTKPGQDPFAAALGALEWRGRDGLGEVEVGGWRIGVTRLAISDPSAGQPMGDSDSGCWVAFNGALTSASSDRERFAARLRTGNDAEILLARFTEGGAAGLHGLYGHYAFALSSPDGRCYLGRDPEGEKPLFVLRERGRVVAFASTVAGIRRLGVSVDLLESERARILRFGFGAAHLGDEPPTPWCELDEPNLQLTSLTPGILHSIAADEGVVDTRSSTAARTVEDAVTLAPSAPDPSRAPSLIDALQDAVSRCADTEVPLALSLSGGVDSACIAACLPGRGLPAYSFRALGESSSEREWATRVADHTGQQLRPVEAGPEILEALPSLTRSHGLPLGDPSVLAAHVVCRAAHADGARVLLSGEGSDELFLGYRRHRLARFLRADGRPRLSFLPTLRARGLAARSWNAMAAGYDSLFDVVDDRFAALAFTREFAMRFREARLPALPSDARRASDDGLGHALRRDRRDYLRCDLLPKLDVATLAAGVEGRCPFLDPGVVRCAERSAALATRADRRRMLGKRPLRRAFERALPAGLFDQRKTGFAVPLDRWLREADFLVDVLRDRRTRERAYIDGPGVSRAIDLHRSGRARFGHALYLLAAVELYDRGRDD